MGVRGKSVGKGKRSHQAVVIKTNFMETQVLEMEFRAWQGFQQGEIRRKGGSHRQRKQNERTHTHTRTHTHFEAFTLTCSITGMACIWIGVGVWKPASRMF